MIVLLQRFIFSICLFIISLIFSKLLLGNVATVDLIQELKTEASISEQGIFYATLTLLGFLLFKISSKINKIKAVNILLIFTIITLLITNYYADKKIFEIKKEIIILDQLHNGKPIKEI